MADDQEEIGPREKLEQEKATAHNIAAAERKRNYYRDDNMMGYYMTDAKGRIINDENDPLLARLEAGLR